MDEQKLVREALQLKPEAQRRLYEHFAPLMLGVCFRYTKTKIDAEEVLQEGFIKVFKNLHHYRS
ncbi:MAG: RNA polymerase subunit sigma-70, partial [Bacteroidota bacterium]|nr:RNA polymerase subunit sigma-70 [Bacteroidota bacterium]